MVAWRFNAIGVPWSIDSEEAIPDSLRELVLSRVEEFDRAYSRFRSDSLVTAMARTPGDYDFPPDLPALLSLYEDLWSASRGAINPLVGQAMDHWGYDANYRLEPLPGEPPVIPPLRETISVTGSSLHALRPFSLDIGAVGKGFLVDTVWALLRDQGVTELVVDGSGDIRHSGGSTERVGLEHPVQTDRVVGVAELDNASLAASATTRRSWPGAHHILNALTGMPTKTIQASWVVAEDCAVADGLATALFTTTPDELARFFGFEWVILDQDNRIYASENFPGEVFA